MEDMITPTQADIGKTWRDVRVATILIGILLFIATVIGGASQYSGMTDSLFRFIHESSAQSAPQLQASDTDEQKKQLLQAIAPSMDRDETITSETPAQHQQILDTMRSTQTPPSNRAKTDMLKSLHQ